MALGLGAVACLGAGTKAVEEVVVLQCDHPTRMAGEPFAELAGGAIRQHEAAAEEQASFGSHRESDVEAVLAARELEQQARSDRAVGGDPALPESRVTLAHCGVLARGRRLHMGRRGGTRFWGVRPGGKAGGKRARGSRGSRSSQGVCGKGLVPGGFELVAS